MRFQSVISVLVLAAASLVGCGSRYDLGLVSGTVRLDGVPLADATVVFVPQSGRSSIAVTDADGRYALVYTVKQLGAQPGEHRVSITTGLAASGAEGDGPAYKGRPEVLPPRYHENTELTAKVSRGRNTIDFELTSAAE